MKKIIGILGIAVLAITMFFNVTLSTGQGVNPKSVTLSTIINANAQSNGECQTCIPNDCAWWDPYCDDYTNAEGVSTWDEIGDCLIYTLDCYPASSGSCTEEIYAFC